MKTFMKLLTGTLGILTLIMALSIALGSVRADATNPAAPSEVEFLAGRIHQRQTEWHAYNLEYISLTASAAILKSKMDDLSDRNNTARDHIKELDGTSYTKEVSGLGNPESMPEYRGLPSQVNL